MNLCSTSSSGFSTIQSSLGSILRFSPFVYSSIEKVENLDILICSSVYQSWHPALRDQPATHISPDEVMRVPPSFRQGYDYI